ncbi:MAG: AsmA family protein, partial [bacterium]|nr:AsmA family protein [bacterium]
MKKLFVFLLSLVLIVVLLLAAVVLLSPAFLSKYKEPILAKASTSLNREITMGDIRLTLLRGFGLRLKDVTVANAAGFRQEPMLSMGGLDLKVKFLPLLRKELQVEKIILQQPRIVIEKDNKGVFNFSDLAGGEKGPPTDKEAARKEGTAGPEALLAGLLVSQVMISDGALTYYDAGSPPLKEGVRVGSLNLAVEDVSLERPIPFSLSFGINRDGTDIKIKGVVGPVGKEINVEQVPLSAQAALDQFALKRILPFMEAPSFTIDEGALSFKADVSGDLASGLKLSGVIDIDGMTLSDAAKKEMLVGLDTSLNVGGNLSGLLQDKITAEMDLSSPNLMVRLPKKSVAHRLNTTQFVRWLVPGAEAATAKRTQSSARGGSGGFDVQGKINIAKGTIGDVPFSDLAGNYSKKGDVVRVTGFSVKGFGPEGVASGNMTFNLAGTAPSYQVDLNAAGIDLATVQDAFTARKEKVGGALSAKLRLSGA